MKFFPPVNKCFIFQDCKSAKCKYIKCILKDIEVNSNYFVKVKTRIWIGTFITVSDLGATLTAVCFFLSPFIIFGAADTLGCSTGHLSEH